MGTLGIYCEEFTTEVGYDQLSIRSTDHFALIFLYVLAVGNFNLAEDQGVTAEVAREWMPESRNSEEYSGDDDESDWLDHHARNYLDVTIIEVRTR
jgi:hypothetical protein